MIGDGPLMLILYLVGHLAGIHQLLYAHLYLMGALGDVADNLDVALAEFLRFLLPENIYHVLHVLSQLALVVGGHGDNMVHGEVSHHTGLDLYFLGVVLPFHLVACVYLHLAQHTHVGKHLDAALVLVTLQHLGTGSLAIQSPALGLFLPLFAIAVAVETDGLAGLDILAYHLQDSLVLLHAVSDEGIYAVLEACQGLGHGRVDDYHGSGAVGRRTHGTILKPVARESEGAGAVTVGVIYQQLRYLGDVHLQSLLALQVEHVLLVRVLYNV